MDIQPSESNQSQPMTPSVPPIQTPPPSNNRWVVILIVVVLVIIEGVVAYFLINRNTSPRQNTQSPVVIYESTPQSQDGSHQIKNYTLQDVKNAYLTKPYLEDKPNFYAVSNDQYLYLKDGLASFSYCEDSISPCAPNKTKQGNVTVSNITPSKDPSLLTVYDGSADGVAILEFDFGYGDKKSYLGAYILYNQEGKNNLYFSNAKSLGTLSEKIQSLDIVSNGEVNVTFATPSGSLSRVFIIVSGRNINTFVELTTDKQKKIYDDQTFGYSFEYPKEIRVYRGQSLRASVMETDLKTSPIYYVQECGLQPSLADSVVPFWSSSSAGSGVVTLNANLTVHKVDLSSVYLTSSLYGYDPADWGKIKQTFSVTDYINDIKAGIEISGRKVSLENIQGYSVRHIMPFSVGRPCDDRNSEQYQWVKGNLLFNLIFTESKTEHASVQQKTELVNSIFSSLKLK
ncbi:MAG: hypothetical protein EXS50_02965 [Candidatus Taylorbacteria bacterium]|nr:hypothetical protein [Candidatus Taylorbacteria bacterium]